jgi:predicted O-linked N-acetylglucosamine transferase (SPINDLY family)
MISNVFFFTKTVQSKTKFNNPRKFTPTVFRTFARILVMAPHAKLFLRYVMGYNSSFYKEAVLCIFTKLDVAREQIEIHSHQIRDTVKDRQEYLNAYNDIDVALDPFPYNVGITSHEALYMNTPLICMEGQNYRSRIGVSLLTEYG